MHFIGNGHCQCGEDFPGLEMPIFPGGVCVCCVTAGLSRAAGPSVGTHSYPFSVHVGFRILTLPV